MYKRVEYEKKNPGEGYAPKGMILRRFGLESGMVFGETTGVYERIYHFNSKWIRKKREICAFEVDFKK